MSPGTGRACRHLLAHAGSAGGPLPAPDPRRRRELPAPAHRRALHRRDRLLCGANTRASSRARRPRPCSSRPGPEHGGSGARASPGWAQGMSRAATAARKETPVTGEGLTKAMRAALDVSGGPVLRYAVVMGDLNGEHFKFKEAALATMRIDRAPARDGSRRPRGHVEHWNVVETIGEVGAALLPAAHRLGLRGRALGAVCRRAACSRLPARTTACAWRWWRDERWR